MTQDEEIMLLLEEAARLDVEVFVREERVVLRGHEADIDAVRPALALHKDRLWSMLTQAKFELDKLLERVGA